MARSSRHRLYNFALVLAICAGVGAAALVLGHSHFNSAPQAADIPPAANQAGELPPLW
jgi:hypothetical protein